LCAALALSDHLPPVPRDKTPDAVLQSTNVNDI